MQNIKPKDYAARQTCALPGAANIIVEAGAGTGKTTLLTERLCYLILGKDISIDKIIALTFTEKAAAEIKLRLLFKMQKILAALDAADIGDETAATLLNVFKKTKDELKENIQKSFELAERAQISTIHSFCLQILRRYPLEAGLAPGAKVDDGRTRQNIFDKLWAAFLERELAAAGPQNGLWKELLLNLNLDEIKTFADTLLSPALEDYAPLGAAAQVRQTCLRFAPEARRLSGLYPASKKRALEMALIDAAGMLEESAQFFEDGKARQSKFNIDKTPLKPANWEYADYEAAQAIIDFARALRVDSQALLIKTFGLLKPFVKEVREACLSENIISYDEIIYKTRALLKDNKTVRAELKKEYKSILIDEFQDTDPMQGEILLFLCEAETGTADNWREILLEPGKLFVVGDPKQSIYRFRGADITAYEKFLALMQEQGALKCFLQTNFRSSQNIIAYANAYGQKAIAEKGGVQPKYIPIDNGRVFEAPPVQLALVENAPEDKIDACRHNSAQFIAAWIKDNAGKTKLAGGKTLAPGDIAILLRTNTALDIFTDALKRFDIKYIVEETRNFYSSQEVGDIINILKVLNDPMDKTALLSVLRSPFAMAEDADILEISQNHALDIFADAKKWPRAARIYKILKNLHYKAGRVSLDSLIEEIIYESGFLELETLATQKEQTAANIFKFVSVLQGLNAGAALTLGQFLYYAETYGKEQNKEGESPLAEESLDAVRIMTMHKAKGLEFPVVFLADTAKKETRRADKKPLYIYDWSSGLAGARLGNFQDSAFALLDMNSSAHENAQELRVLYVALTRAKERLIITGDLIDGGQSLQDALRGAGCWPPAGEKPQTLMEGPARAELSYLHFRPPEDFLDLSFAAGAGHEAPLDIEAWFEARRKRLAVYKESLGRRIIKPGARGEEEDSAAPRLRDDAASIVGTLCHKLIFNIFTNSPQTPRQAAAAEGFAPEVFAQQLNEAQAIIDSFTQSALFKKLRDMRLMAAEMPFTFKDADGRIISGVMDAVFQTCGGTLFIADYKSDNIPVGQAARRGTDYARQLGFYKTALQAMFKYAKIEAAVIYMRAAEQVLI